MTYEYVEIHRLPGFDKLSAGARAVAYAYAEDGRVRTCDKCGKLILGSYYSVYGTDYCSVDCMESDGMSEREFLFQYYGLPSEEPEDFDENDDYGGFMLDLWATKDTDGLSRKLEALENDRDIEPSCDGPYVTSDELELDDPAVKEFYDWFASKKTT